MTIKKINNLILDIQEYIELSNEYQRLKKKYNKTVLLTFKIYRFLFLTSIFSLIIHFILYL